MSKWSSAFRDSRWQKKRLEIMERDGWACRSCGASGEGVTLNVHHINYESGKAPWEYQNNMLVTWCEKCHARMHYLQALLLEQVAMADNPESMICRLIGYADGIDGPCRHSGDDYEQGYAECNAGWSKSLIADICAVRHIPNRTRRPL